MVLSPPTPTRPHWPARRVALLGTVLQAAAEKCEAGCAPALLRAIANAHSALATAPATAASKAVFSPEAWRHAVLQLLATAPERYDVALPYMNWLTLHGDTAGLRDFLARAPDSTHQSCGRSRRQLSSCASASTAMLLNLKQRNSQPPLPIRF